MRAGRYPWIILPLALIISLGCRGPKPMGGLVQVTEDPSVDVSDVEPVPQRLASAHKLNTPDAPGDGLEGESAASKMVQQAAARRGAEKMTDRVSTKPVPTRRPKPASKPTSGTALIDELTQLTKRPVAQTQSRSGQSKLAAEGAPNVPPRNSTSTLTGKPAATESKVAATEVVATRNPSSDAFAQSPPKVQAAAIRRFVSAVARRADRVLVLVDGAIIHRVPGSELVGAHLLANGSEQ